MKKYNLLLFCLMLGSLAYGQVTTNLLPVEDWTEGNGTVSVFVQNGSNAENVRALGVDPHDETSVIWTCTAPGNSGPDGGWNAFYDIDHTKTYRQTVWVRRNTSNSGTTYFGARNGAGFTLNLNGTGNSNPYFWAGDLPEIGKWYLMVGYVHSSNYTGTQSYGGIYDGETGEKVINMKDFKNVAGITQQRHRSYYFYSTDPSVQTQDFWGPRAEAVDGNEPTIEALLGIDYSAKTAGNLLPIEKWTEGTGSQAGFVRHGLDADNVRMNMVGPEDTEVLGWRCLSAPGTNGQDGGYQAFYDADHEKSYRLSYWIRRNDSNTGTSYFRGSSNSTLKLDGSAGGVTQFWAGDPPTIGEWYLMVGYIHGSNHTDVENFGGIYNKAGEKVQSITDFKWLPTTTLTRMFTFTNSMPENESTDHYAPRVEVINGLEPSIGSLIGLLDEGSLTGNLLPVENWTPGEGALPDFAISGAANESIREIGIDPHNESSILWKSQSNGTASGDGGWISYFPVEHQKTYRLSGWVKRTGDNSGVTYFGPGYNSNALNLDGTPNVNPIFYYNDLPELDKWYLMVGYVHGSDYTGTENIGGIYDGVTGEKVINLTDFKNSVDAVESSHRLLLYQSGQTTAPQYQWGARAEAVDGNEPTIEALLGIPKEFIWSEITDGAVYNDGSVGIGVDENDMDTAYKLLVDGDIKSRKVKVTLDGWADYVFEEDYNLLPLAEVEKFININGHLPEVPNTATVLEEGIFLGDTDVLLLKKIEELTLYIIQLEKKVNQLEQEVGKQ